MKVIVNADDFALSKSATDAICEAYSEALITDTTMVANSDLFDYAIIKAVENKMINSIGIHFNLTHGSPLTKEIKDCKRLVGEDGRFINNPKRLKRMVLTHREAKAIEIELEAQANRFLDRKIELTHADSHRHIHYGFFIGVLVRKVCLRKGIKKIRKSKFSAKDKWYKKFYKKIWNMAVCSNPIQATNYFGALSDYKDLKKKDCQIIEIMVHPDYCDNILIDMTSHDKCNHPTGPILSSGGGYCVKMFPRIIIICSL